MQAPGGVTTEPAHHGLGRSRGGLSTKVHLACEQRQKPLSILQSLHRRRVGVGVEGLDAQQHEATRADLGQVIGGRNMDLGVTLDAAHPQTTLGESLQVRAARDRAHSRSGPGGPAAEMASGAAIRIPRSLPARGLPRWSA